MQTVKKLGLVILALVILVTASGTTFAGERVDLKLDSHAAVLMEPNSGEILFQQNQDQKMHPASVTKLMVMLLVLEAVERNEIKWTDVIPASPQACKMGGSQIWLEPGEQMTVAELFKAVCIVSANDASYALGEHLAGSEESFVALMNKRAKEVGLKQTTYVNTTGLEPDSGGTGNMTTAMDMALLAREVVKHPSVFKWSGVWIDSLRGGKSFLRNTNNLVRFYQGCDGLKTGFTAPAGFCLVATAKRDGVRMIAVAMKATTSKTRAADISKMLNYGFSQYKAYRVYNGRETVGKVRVFRGKSPYVSAVVPSELTAVLKRNQKGTIEKKIILDSMVQAPVQSGQKIGQVVLTIGGQTCGQVNLVAGAKVERASFLELWGQIFKKIIGSLVAKG